ncbi:MAG: hypothetical protein EBE86_024020 [Hormoscilla sp. GUM202]|nr:hypothetical protein [Hormoscilla sp. GUM202]
MPIETWFPLAIYYTDLPDAAAHRDSLLGAVLALEEAAHERRITEETAWTGDVHGVERIHDDPNFAWIVEQLEIKTTIYLKALGVDLNKIDLYIQRSWPIISRPTQRILDHRHLNAHLSAVYYIAVPQTGDSGSLVFFNDTKMNEVAPGLWADYSSGLAESNTLNFETVTYAPVEGRLVMFPAKQRHGVEANQTEELRVSLSFDIILTSAETSDAGLYEFLSPPPKQWKKLKHKQAL